MKHALMRPFVDFMAIITSELYHQWQVDTSHRRSGPQLSENRRGPLQPGIVLGIAPRLIGNPLRQAGIAQYATDTLSQSIRIPRLHQPAILPMAQHLPDDKSVATIGIPAAMYSKSFIGEVK